MLSINKTIENYEKKIMDIELKMKQNSSNKLF